MRTPTTPSLTPSAGAVALLAILVLLVTGCGELFGAPSGPRAEFLGQWVLANSQLDGAPIVVPDGHRITLTIEQERLGGTAACNSYGGENAINGTTFDLGDGLAMTEMGCEPAVMEAESRYVDALQRVDVIQRADEQLLLMGQGVELRFDPVEPVDDAAVVGTRWVLDTLIDGEVAMSVQGGGFLQLHDDGTLDGSTGCRDLRGRWQLAGDEIVFPEFGATGECPPELEQQDSHVVSVLESFRVEVEGDRLTLTSDGDEGLVYRRD